MTNTCESCITGQGIESSATRPGPLLFDTGVCDTCGATADVADLDLVDLYRGLGLTDEFVHAHLPRLRRSPHAELTWKQIGSEVARHARFGECASHPCQGYSHRPWQFVTG